MTQVFAGLPRDITSPHQAAHRIASLTTREQRQHYIDSLPSQWQRLIMHEAVQLMAAQIVAIGDLETRRVALSRVPEDWLRQVKQYVVMMWKRRALQSRQEARV